MTIDRLGPVDPVSKFNKTDKATRTNKKAKPDSIDVSSEAKTMGEIYKATEEVKLSPEVRQQKIEEVKEKLKDPTYISDKVLESVAESIMDVFKI